MKPLVRTAALLLTASAILLSAAPANARVDVSIGINVPPPVHHVEVVPAQRHGYIWAPGYWRWTNHHHVWVEGRWLKARPGYIWAPERWERRGDHHHFTPGRWAPDHNYRRDHGRRNDHERRNDHDRRNDHGPRGHDRNW